VDKEIHDKGFTLIELLITLAVLSFGLLGLAGLQVGLVRANAFNGSMTIATTIGTDLLEEARDDGFHNLTDAVDEPLLYRIDDGNGTLFDPYNGRFTVTRSISTMPGLNLKEVVIDVSWRGSKTHQLTFKTSIAG
jgi:prepilin-type N-terminal cleavage/methylation domain-containing protein